MSKSQFRKLKRGLQAFLVVLFALVSLIFTNEYQREPNVSNPLVSADGYYIVTDVVDGDTIKLQMEDGVETARLIGVNTPETVDPRREVECFGREASSFLKAQLLNQQVAIAFDPTQDQRDRYGRLLLYVWLIPGLPADAEPVFINKLLIAEGYAYEYTYQKPYQYQQEFKQAQTSAESANKGLWGSCIN